MCLSTLSELIADASKVELQTGSRTSKALLTEQQEPTCSVWIQGLSNQTFVLNLDVFTKVSDNEIGTNMFKGDRGERKRADYIIIEPEKKVIVFVELKCQRNRNCNSSLIDNQLRGAKCLFGYIKCVLSEFWNLDDFLHDFNELAVCIVSTTEKRKTDPKALSSENTRFKKVYAKDAIYFRKLIEASP